MWKINGFRYRKKICREFGIKLTQTAFTSDFSSANAERAGYRTDVSMKFSEIVEKHPNLAELENVKSKAITLKSLII